MPPRASSGDPGTVFCDLIAECVRGHIRFHCCLRCLCVPLARPIVSGTNSGGMRRLPEISEFRMVVTVGSEDLAYEPSLSGDYLAFASSDRGLVDFIKAMARFK
mmetsp:Transcript_136226/g.236868  ORF Transcript_136226/g.236868 Transcript_136226/m.236868 type:complete len:104 (+) Transcript_136226:1271-1582(+)